jgi:hypothetical protein
MPGLHRSLTLLIAAASLFAAACATVQAPPVEAPQAPTPAGQTPETERAIVHFRSASNALAPAWGLLFTHDDLVVVKEDRAPGQAATLLNTPRRFDKEFLNQAATVKGIPRGQVKTFALEPGVYDWLVLVDTDGDGELDGYVGTSAAQGPLASFEFLAGKQYFIDIDAEGELTFAIEPDAGHPGEDPRQATYLAIVDALADRLAQVDDATLREYVGLVVEEIDALRQRRGDLCYDLIQAEDRGGVFRAYESLPPDLKVRESALVDRVLRAAREEREILSEEEAEDALAPVARELRRTYGDDAEIIEDEERFEENKDLGCSIHRDLLAMTLLMPIEEAAPIWRFMFSGEDDEDDGEERERPAVTNI